MKIFDAHCDVLLKMWLNPQIAFENEKSLHITLDHLKKTGAKVQCFAIFVPDHVSGPEKFHVALQMVDIFYSKIVEAYDEMKLVTSKREIEALESGEIGAFLTLEGCDSIGDDLSKLRILHRLGVRSIGLTWNHANLVADGIMEERGAGLTTFGKEVVRLNNELKLWTDVSHLSEKGFWDVMEEGKYVIASHSNSKKLCPHPRNLTDEQIKSLIKRDSIIGVTFVPKFLASEQKASLTDVLRHIEHICSLGGEKNIGFGSDFDGITDTPAQLEHYGKYEKLINELLKHYNETLVKGFCFDHFARQLPE
ncbi:dipeptidase [Fictibacillus sp. Mic-4]|uniref:dipeptidase n=1 Tax=Fictibacillus TaxID=1329200 RepID=UPI0003F68E6B|nr:dipeptidase [Fictibacillus gelatini]